MSTWSRQIDKVISNIAKERHILYFYSENRNIIEEAVNELPSVHQLLHEYAPRGMPLYKALVDAKKCRDILEVFSWDNNGLRGSITRSDKDYSWPPKLLVLRDFHIYSEIHRLFLIEAFLNYQSREQDQAILMISSPLCFIPSGYSSEIELISDIAISPEDIREEIQRKLDDRRNEYLAGGYASSARALSFGADEINHIAGYFAGLSRQQVKSLLSRMAQGDLAENLRVNTAKLIAEERIQDAKKDAVIQFQELDKNPVKFSGMGRYERWLQDRREDYADPEVARQWGLSSPKGILICGVPGTGKTHMAEQTAKLLKVPLVQFNLSQIETKDYGGSQANLDRFFNQIDCIDRCVLLIDEFEKLFETNSSTHEVKKAMVGQLLGWMQQRESHAFLFLTANDISGIRLELLRDGRINARFFAFLPRRDELTDLLRFKMQSKMKDSEHLFNEETKEVINKTPEDPNDDVFKRMFDQIAMDARQNDPDNKSYGADTQASQEVRYPFMTGANLEALIELALQELRKAKRKEGGKSSLGYSIKDFIDTMRRCAISDSFVPDGSSNARKIARIWLKAQESMYQNVSDRDLLPFSKFEDGRFIRELDEPDNAYDKYLQETFKKKIEEEAKQQRRIQKMLDEQAQE